VNRRAIIIRAAATELAVESSAQRRSKRPIHPLRGSRDPSCRTGLRSDARRGGACWGLIHVLNRLAVVEDDYLGSDVQRQVAAVARTFEALHGGRGEVPAGTLPCGYTACLRPLEG